MQFALPGQQRRPITLEEFQAMLAAQQRARLQGQPGVVAGLPSPGTFGGQAAVQPQAAQGVVSAVPGAPPGREAWMQGRRPVTPAEMAVQRQAPATQQGRNEPGASHLLRLPGAWGIEGARWVGDQAAQFGRGLTETPAQAEARVLQTQQARVAQEAAGGVGGGQDFATAFGAPAAAAFNPFAGFRSTSGPGDPRPGGRQHRGRDWAMPMGTPITAPRNWRVLQTGEDRTSGHWARVQFDDGSVHSFAHLSGPPQQQFGSAGQPIALSGRSGNATGPSVHTRSWVGGQEVDPGTYFTGSGGAMPPGGMIPPLAFDESGYRRAQDMQTEAARLMQQPVEQSWDPGPRPEVPTPTPIEPTDFSAVTKRLEATEPEPMSDRDRLRTQRRGWLAGLARGLASVDLSASGGAGVGQLLAAVGAGALGGRQAADEEIQRREDLHDQQMREYNMLMAQHETVRAQDVAQIMRYNAQQAYDHELRQFGLELEDWTIRARPQVQGGRIFSTRRNEDGSYTMRSAPIDNSALAGAMVNNAQIEMAIAAGQAEVGRANWQFNAANVMAGAAQSGEPQDIATAVSVRVAETLQSGIVRDVIGEDQFEQLTAAATEAAMAQVPLTMQGSAAEAQRLQIMQQTLIAGITALAMQDQALRAALFGGSGQIARGAAGAVRQQNRQETSQERRTPGRLPTITNTVRQ